MKTKILLLTSLALTSNLAWGAAAELGALARAATRVASRAAVVSMARPVLPLASRPFAVEVFPVSPFPVRGFSTRVDPTAETSPVEASSKPALSESKKPKKEYITIPPELYDYENLDRGAMRIAEYVRKHGLEKEFKEKVINNCVGEGFEKRFGGNFSRFNFLKTWINDIRTREESHRGDQTYKEYLSREADTVRGVLNNEIIALSRVTPECKEVISDEQLADLENIRAFLELYIKYRTESDSEGRLDSSSGRMLRAPLLPLDSIVTHLDHAAKNFEKKLLEMLECHDRSKPIFESVDRILNFIPDAERAHLILKENVMAHCLSQFDSLAEEYPEEAEFFRSYKVDLLRIEDLFSSKLDKFIKLEKVSDLQTSIVSSLFKINIITRGDDSKAYVTAKPTDRLAQSIRNTICYLSNLIVRIKYGS